jgi:hypothetical protein
LVICIKFHSIKVRQVEFELKLSVQERELDNNKNVSEKCTWEAIFHLLAIALPALWKENYQSSDIHTV